VKGLEANASKPGDPNGVETISGAGSAQEQSSVDLGQGTISGSPSLTWTLSGSETINTNVQQNSSLDLSGGVTISGSGVKIQQGSNGFLSVGNGGTNSATIVCANSANNPYAHLSFPTSATPNVTTYNLNDVIAGVSGASHPGQPNDCANF
jgi:hypothetical protein